MVKEIVGSIAVFSILMAGCQNTSNKENQDNNNPESASFSTDLAFLKKQDSGLVVLSSADKKAQVIVSPKYQAKVFTSTATGGDGRSFGWINYDAFDTVDGHMNAYGGEDRLWLGPEGGPFSLFFQPGTEMVFKDWHTPAPIDVESWDLVSASQEAVELSKDMQLQNYAGTQLQLNIRRKIEMLNPAGVEAALSITLGKEVNTVGFKTTNTLSNKNDFAWDKETGAPCMWNLDMFTPSPKTVIVIPFRTDVEGKVATTDYFGEIPKDRIKMEDGVIYFKADGKSRGKLGVPPLRTKSVAGSYAADNGVLTIISFDVDTSAIYLNQEWTTEKDPFIGDAMNAYNDGPLEDGSQMGPFYEMESVSPAAFLHPGGAIVHHHSVFHFTGDKKELNAIAEKVLGISLSKIESVFDEDK